MKYTTYLISHTAPNGTNVAQTRVCAANETRAREQFHRLHPGRIISAVGTQ